jgi:hypothetical protein
MSARMKIWFGVAALLVLVLGANAHLLYVAVTSQPNCVAHEAPGASQAGTYSAAESSCSPQAEGKSQ